MGCQPIYGSIAVGTYNGSHRRTTHPAFDGSLAEPKWSWQMRSPKTWRDKNRWDSLWSFGCRVGSGDANMDGASPIGLSTADGFEPFSCDGDGCQFKNRIKGQCLDSVGAPVANAIVQGFVTATDAYVGEVTADNAGYYQCMTERSTATPHYLVAYKTGSPDLAGTTVNTILPTAT